MSEQQKDDTSDPVWEHLSKFGQLAHNDALLEILTVVATAAGVTEINGVPLQIFFEKRKHEIVEKLVAEFADTNPAVASKVRAAWQKLCY